MNKTVTVTENGRPVKKQKWEIIIAQQVNKAVSSDLKSAHFVIDQMFKYGLLNDEDDGAAAKITGDEEAVLAIVMHRLRASLPNAFSGEGGPDADPSIASNEEGSGI